MLLRRYPNVSITPLTQITQLLHFRMIVLDVVFEWQVSGIVDAHVAAESP